MLYCWMSVLPKLRGSDVLLKMKEKRTQMSGSSSPPAFSAEMKPQMSHVTVKHFIDKPYMLDEVAETLQSLIDAPVASSGF